MKKYVIGFKLRDGTVELDSQHSGTLSKVKAYFDIHYAGFDNARIFLLKEDAP